MSQSIQIGERLREERKRLALKQDAMGVTPQAQRRYEIGERSPDTEYLANAADMGMDVQYIVTGVHCSGHVTTEEDVLLTAFRAASQDMRKAALAVLLSGSAPASPRLGNVKVGGDIGQIVQGGSQHSFTVMMGGKKNKQNTGDKGGGKGSEGNDDKG